MSALREMRSSTSSTSRPLPLKQRTSSSDTRRDYNSKTWTSLLVLLKLREYFVTVDHFSIWRRHLAWAMENGKDLRGYMTQRYASNMVFMGLLLSTELSVLFNSAKVTTDVRMELRSGNHASISFWAGFMIIVSALLTLLSLIATFTAWAMVNAVDEANAHCIFRSSIGQYAAELPGRFIVCSIYSFLISFTLFFFLLLPVGLWSIALMLTTVTLFVHVVAAFSSFGRVIMHTGAMGRGRIFDPDYEMSLLPHSLHANLLNKAKANLANKTSITRQYRRKQNPIDRYYSEFELYEHLNNRNAGTSAFSRDSILSTPRDRADSTVRFADEEAQSQVPSTVPTPPPQNTSSYQLPNHQRTFTPLSDVSTPFSSRPLHRKCRDDPSDPNDNGKIARPPRPGIIKVSESTNTNQSMSGYHPAPSPPLFGGTTSSMASIEQWIQASPTPPNSSSVAGMNHQLVTTGAPKLLCPADASNTAAPLATTNTSQGFPVTPTNRSPPPPPPPTEVTTWKTTSSPANDQLDQLDEWNDRNMTEDERFAMDYGDISDPDDFHVIERIGSQCGGGSSSGTFGSSTKAERELLLVAGRHNSNYNYDSASSSIRQSDTRTPSPQSQPLLPPKPSSTSNR